jgi:DNA-binding beta-propeller fold protein YncE
VEVKRDSYDSFLGNRYTRILRRITMSHRSRGRSLIVLIGIGLPAALWIGISHRSNLVIAQEAGKPSEKRSLSLDRAPVRMISDPNPVFSGIAIDGERGEVFMTNDKESAEPSVVVFPTQFQPVDGIMEPRRRLAGPQTRLQLPCGIAISPEYNEMFTISGDGASVEVYPLEANGDTSPSRQLSVPHASGGVFLDPKHDELFVTTEHVNRINVYRRTAQGKEKPLRYIQGPSTELADPHGIYVNTATDEIFVANDGSWRKTEPGEGVGGDDYYNSAGGTEPLPPSSGKFLAHSITIYSRTANGDVAPLRRIQGPHTQLSQPVGIFRDPVSGQIIIANSSDNSVLFFDANASGDAAPLRVIQGPATNLKGPTGISVDAKRNELWVTSWDNHSTNVYPRTAAGNVAPLRVIHSAPKDAPLATMGRLGSVAYDPKRKEILMPN